MNYVMLSDRTREGEVAIHVQDQSLPGPQTQTLTRCGRHFQGADIFETVELDDPYDRKCQDCFHRQAA